MVRDKWRGVQKSHLDARTFNPLFLHLGHVSECGRTSDALFDRNQRELAHIYTIRGTDVRHQPKRSDFSRNKGIIVRTKPVNHSIGINQPRLSPRPG